MSAAPAILDRSLGRVLRDTHVALKGSGRGPLAGLTFATKDVFHIAGHRTGFGNPDWLRTHPVATETADAVQRLLDAGADMIGKTHTDELAYSLSGENVHYGTPLNPRAPDRVPGGSSCGSVSAVACGLVDFAIGTDCGGSIRLPASYCGVLGMRPTHDRVSLDGAIPFAPSFDVAGWFARDADVFERVGEVLLGEDAASVKPARMLIADDAFAVVEKPVAEALQGAVAQVAAQFARRGARHRQPRRARQLDGHVPCRAGRRDLGAARRMDHHREAAHRRRNRVAAGDRVEARARCSRGREGASAASVIARLDALIGKDDVLVLPTSPRIAPLKGTEQGALEVTYRFQAMQLLCIAGLGGLPQISLPFASLDGCPLGLSIVGRRGSDRMLLALARRIMESTT